MAFFRDDDERGSDDKRRDNDAEGNDFGRPSHCSRQVGQVRT
jgi:hypothetical protein